MDTLDPPRHAALPLDARGAVDYLLEHALLQPRDIVLGPVTIVDASRRNLNWEIRLAEGRGYFLKQARDASTHETLHAEIRTYEWLERCAPRSPLSDSIPRLRLADADRGLVVLDLVPGSRNRREFIARSRRASRARAARLGRALAQLHELAPDPTHEAEAAPWILAFHEPPLELLDRASEANLQLLEAVQKEPEVGRMLTSLAERWHPSGVAHLDLKSENLMVPRAARRDGLVVIDWELARRGDPAWDVGSVLADYLTLWLGSMPVRPNDPVDLLPGRARLPLERLQPAIRAFWEGYERQRRFAGADGRAFLSKACGYAAARLLQTAHEHLHGAAQLTGLAVLLLQVSFNILRRPEEAQAHLFAIPLAG